MLCNTDTGIGQTLKNAVLCIWSNHMGQTGQFYYKIPTQ